MDRKDFLEQLFLMFPKNYCEANASIWRRAYEEVLPLTADFDSLMHTMISEYSGSTIPKPAWFKSKPEVTRAIYAEQQKIDAENGKVIQTIDIETTGFSTGFNKITGTNLAVITDIKENKYTIIDLEKGKVLKTYALNIPVKEVIITNKVKLFD